MPNLAPTELSHAHNQQAGSLTSQTLAHRPRRPRPATAKDEIINAAQAQTKESRLRRQKARSAVPRTRIELVTFRL